LRLRSCTIKILAQLARENETRERNKKKKKKQKGISRGKRKTNRREFRRSFTGPQGELGQIVKKADEKRQLPKGREEVRN